MCKTFFAEVLEVHSVLQVLRRYLRKLDADSARINDVLPLTMNLETDIENQRLAEWKKQDIIGVYRRRRDVPVSASTKVLLLQDIHWAAHCLDPNAGVTKFGTFDYRGRIVNVIQQYCRTMFPNDLLAKVKEAKLMNAFSVEQYSWRNIRLSGNDAALKFYMGRPLQYWTNCLCRDLEFKQFAQRVLSASPTSCAVEKSFSAMKRISTKPRNRLKNEKVRKLMFCYWNLRIQLGASPVDRIELWDGDSDMENEQISRLSASVSGSPGSGLHLSSAGRSLAGSDDSISEREESDLWGFSDEDTDNSPDRGSDLQP